MLGYDPEDIRGYSDADIEVQQLEAAAHDVEAEAKAILVGRLMRFPTSDELAAEIDRLYADDFGV